MVLVRICACLYPEPWAKLGEAVGLFLAITSFLPSFLYVPLFMYLSLCTSIVVDGVLKVKPHDNLEAIRKKGLKSY